MEFIDNKAINDFSKNGVVLCRGIFREWLDTLRVGVDKLIKTLVREKDHILLKMERPLFFKIW